MRIKGEGKIVSCAIIPHEDLDETKLVGEGSGEGEENAPAVETEKTVPATENTDNE